jgi:hypothetical protein
MKCGGTKIRFRATLKGLNYKRYFLQRQFLFNAESNLIKYLSVSAHLFVEPLRGSVFLFSFSTDCIGGY